MVNRHPEAKQALSWETLSAVTSNPVLTGRTSYHRDLEHAVLELTLFKTVPSKMETHRPPPQVTAPHHPAAPQARARLAGIPRSQIPAVSG